MLIAGDDFAQYLLSDDARSAEFWQLTSLASLRRGLGRPVSQLTYERWRALHAADAAQRATEPTQIVSSAADSDRVER